MLRRMITNGVSGEPWGIKTSQMARKTQNPIRRIVEGMNIKPNAEKDMISLSVGDPTKFGNLLPSVIAENAVISAIKDRKHNGYAPSYGTEEARTAVAKYVSIPENPVTSMDVVLASGCSGAIEFAIYGLVNPGEKILVPRPGFSLYKTIAEPMGIHVLYYDLLPNRGWEVDLKQLDSIIDSDTKLLIVNNPSNPCGSVYSKEHIKDILALANRRKLPILADEVYAHFVFPGNIYHSVASLSHEVPILSCGGLTKRFVVPGWRMGWVVIHDPCGNLSPEVRTGILNLSQKLVGPNTLIQAAIPQMLEKIPQSYFDNITEFVAENAEFFYKRISNVVGLRPIMPRGAMYIMVEVDMVHFTDIKTDMQFVSKLVNEQSVFCLPGSCFQYPNYIRCVLTLPRDKLDVACERIEEFCQAHYR